MINKFLHLPGLIENLFDVDNATCKRMNRIQDKITLLKFLLFHLPAYIILHYLQIPSMSGDFLFTPFIDSNG